MHTVDEREGGAARASFGDAPEMQVDGRVVAWEPPHRIVFGGGEGVADPAFEWLVEARQGGTCIVRLVNSGSGAGAEWDGQHDAMTEGWRQFLFNLTLPMEHVAGRTAGAVLPMASWRGDRETAWPALTEALGVPPAPAVGDRVVAGAPDAPQRAGTVVEVSPQRSSMLVDEPAPGTAFLVAEGHGDVAGISVWSHRYGDDGAGAADRDGLRWQAWLAARAHAPQSGEGIGPGRRPPVGSRGVRDECTPPATAGDGSGASRGRRLPSGVPISADRLRWVGAR